MSQKRTFLAGALGALAAVLAAPALQAAVTVTLLGVPGDIAPGESVTLRAQVEGAKADLCYWAVTHDAYALAGSRVLVAAPDGSVQFKAPAYAALGTYLIQVFTPMDTEAAATARIPVRGADPLAPVDEPLLVKTAKAQQDHRIRCLRILESRMWSREPGLPGPGQAGKEDALTGLFLPYLKRFEDFDGALGAYRANLAKLASLEARTRAFPWKLEQVRRADELLVENAQIKLLLSAACLSPDPAASEAEKRLRAILAMNPSALEKARKEKSERKAKEAEARRAAEAMAKAKAEEAAERREHREERKLERRVQREVYLQSVKRIEGLEREATLEERQADAQFQQMVEEDRKAFDRKRREGRLPSLSSPSSSGAGSASPDLRPAPAPVAWLEEAEAEDFSTKVVADETTRRRIQDSIQALRETGRLRGTKQVAPGIYELRPSGGQSTWRPLYTWRDGGYLILALAREALESPSGFEAGVERALARLRTLP